MNTASMTRVLHLTLHRAWFDAIAYRVKTQEYRRMSAHWRRVFEPHLQGGKLPWEEIHFRNGYSKGRPWMRVELLGLSTGEWEGAPCYVLKLGEILEMKNWP